MDNRQSDSFIIQLMRSNNLGGKGATCGDTCCGNLFSAQGLVKTGLWIQWGMLIDTQVFVRKSATWGVQCRKASRWDLLGACLARGTSTNQSRTFGAIKNVVVIRSVRAEGVIPSSTRPLPQRICLKGVHIHEYYVRSKHGSAVL